ncbi:hypothetical protein BDN70DRAFT_882357 [Pholiota conissans]|uniref:Uncharacterized protein n=1 Tax=Pholiota conissans TaxID=109636 RepID=A0A9P5YVF0_9AGAR|nr:hypothetical protein BDN70DRAFT_882357 [Pholiota conissans]
MAGAPDNIQETVTTAENGNGKRKAVSAREVSKSRSDSPRHKHRRMNESSDSSDADDLSNSTRNEIDNKEMLQREVQLKISLDDLHDVSIRLVESMKSRRANEANFEDQKREYEKSARRFRKERRAFEKKKQPFEEEEQRYEERKRYYEEKDDVFETAKQLLAARTHAAGESLNEEACHLLAFLRPDRRTMGALQPFFWAFDDFYHAQRDLPEEYRFEGEEAEDFDLFRVWIVDHMPDHTLNAPAKVVKGRISASKYT